MFHPTARPIRSTLPVTFPLPDLEVVEPRAAHQRDAQPNQAPQLRRRPDLARRAPSRRVDPHHGGIRIGRIALMPCTQSARVLVEARQCGPLSIEHGHRHVGQVGRGAEPEA